MGRHRTAQEKVDLGEAARALRAQGRSRAQIVTELHVGDDLLTQLLAGSELPDGLRRPRAKDDAREAARALRRQGRTYDEIALELGVSKSSCSLWLRDLPHPAEVVLAADTPVAEVSRDRERARELRRDGALLSEIAAELGVSVTAVHRWCRDLPVPPRARHGGDPEHMTMMRRRYWDRVLAEREQERAHVQRTAAAVVGQLSSRELRLVATTAYWAEGSKSKPHRRQERVSFINSDPGMVLLWLAYLDDIDVPHEHRRYTVAIHETADVLAAQRWWSDLIGVPADRFSRPNIKKHNPRTVRHNTGEDYRGCLVVRLVQCRTIYQQIEGTWQGIMAGMQPSSTAPSRVV